MPTPALLALLALASAPAAPGPDDVPAWERCYAAVDWFAAVRPPVESEARLNELAMSSGFGKFAREWIGAALGRTPGPDAWLAEARAARRPVLWYVPAIEGSHVILPHLVDRYVEVGLWSDPRVAELLERRFVAVKCPAAGELARRFDLVPPRFVEPGYLVLSPEGEVLLRVDGLYTFQPEAHLGLLRGLLAELGPAAAPSPSLRRARAAWEADPSAERSLALAREALADGEPTLAERALDDADERHGRGPARDLMRAELLREERRTDEARALLDELDDAASAPGARDGAARERALLALAAGDLAAAEEPLRRVASGTGPRAPECGYRLGALLWLTRREDEARAAWSDVLARFPDDLWAARSSAYLAVGTDGMPGEGPLTRGMEDLLAPDPASAATGTRGPRPTDDVDEVVRRALGFLLRQQRSDGSWLGSRWGGDGGAAPAEPVSLGPGTLANIHTAISALACLALLEWRTLAPHEVDAALARGEPYLLRDDLVVRDETAVIWSYADAFRALYFARRFPDAAVRPEHVSAALDGWVGALLRQQEELGGSFSHFTYTSTFVTAMVVLCLDEARAAGVPVPEPAFGRAADVLAAARGGEQGLFGYLLEVPALNRTINGAACRQPLCTLALLRCGRGGAEDVAAGLDLYLQSWAGAVEPPRKTNFHMPELDGSAGYFFFHNLLAAALATRVTGERRPELRARLLERVCELPEVDGSFVDSGFSYGKGYSTAAALCALAELLGARD